MGVRFGVFSLDARARQLLNGSRPIHLSQKAFERRTSLTSTRRELKEGARRK